PVPYAARALAVDRRAAWHTHAARSITRSVLSEIHREQVAVFFEGGGNRGRPTDPGAGALCPHHRRFALLPRALHLHPALRRRKTLRLSGDTAWVDALVSVAAGADLFVIECFAYSGELPGHITWDVLKLRLHDLRARRIMLTHMNPVMLAHLDEVRAAGALVAEDGAVIDL